MFAYPARLAADSPDPGGTGRTAEEGGTQGQASGTPCKRQRKSLIGTKKADWSGKDFSGLL